MAIGGGQFSLGDAVLNIIGDVTGLNKALGQAESAAKKSFGNILNLGKQIGAGMTVAGGAIVAGLGHAVKAAAESEQALAQLDAVLKSTGGAAGVTREAAIALASEMQRLTTFSDEEVLSAENLLLTFTKIGKDVFPQATETVLNMSTALGQDLKSSSIQLGKALQDPVLGMTALRRVGVNFTKDQVEMVKQMVKNGETMKAQKFILAELAAEFGGSARKQTETFTGKLKQLWNQFNDVEETIGAALIPVLQELANRIIPIVQQIADWAAKNKEAFANITLLVGAVGVLFVTLGPFLVVLPGIVSLFTALWTAGSALAVLFTGPLAIACKGLIALIGVPGAIGIGIAGTIAGLLALLETFNNPTGFDNFLTRMVDRLLPNFGAWIDRTMDKIVGMIQKFKEFIGLDAAASSGLNPALAGGARGLAGSFASGGTASRPGSYLVGERGPEIVDLPSGSRVHDAQSTSGMMGGMSFKIDIHGQDIRSISEHDMMEFMRRTARAGKRYSGR